MRPYFTQIVRSDMGDEWHKDGEREIRSTAKIWSGHREGQGYVHELQHVRHRNLGWTQQRRFHQWVSGRFGHIPMAREKSHSTRTHSRRVQLHSYFIKRRFKKVRSWPLAE